MPTTVIANDGDTLCGLAIDAGFIDCKPIRDEPQNQGKDFLNRPTLKKGDKVVIPDKKLKDEHKAVDAKHIFGKKNAPGVSIRFVHGSPDKEYSAEDFTLTALNISNYQTNLAGATGQGAFPRSYGFNADGHADPDTFKVEVVDPAAGGPVTVILEAMKPVYKNDGTVDHHEVFGGAQAAGRKANIICQKVSSGVAYRSKYLRLVTDDLDQAAVADQTLMVTDIADGLGTGKPTDNDFLEILDQQVRASYSVKRCPAPQKCTVSAQLPIGEDRLRIKLAIHVFRGTVGTKKLGMNGVSEQMLRRRTFRWFRRTYAQANMAPKLVDPVEFIDPPADNMLVISQGHGQSCHGLNWADNQSTLSFTLSTPPPHPPDAAPDKVVVVDLQPFLTPAGIGILVIKALPAGFHGVAHANAAAFNALRGSCDVLIEREDGKRVMISNETTDDKWASVKVARVNINDVHWAPGPMEYVSHTTDCRRLIRAAPGKSDQVDVYVVGHFCDDTRGFTLLRCWGLKPPFQPPDPLRLALILATTSQNQNIVDNSDNSPFSFPHEAGHIFNDGIHVDAHDPNFSSQLMKLGTSSSNSAGASKRISDSPVLVECEFLDVAFVDSAHSNRQKLMKIAAAPRFRIGAKAVSEGW